jgi:hypothetical protein
MKTCEHLKPILHIFMNLVWLYLNLEFILNLLLIRLVQRISYGLGGAW